MPYTEKDYELANTPAAREAKKKLKLHIDLGDKEQERLVSHCASNVPSDSYVPPHRMNFVVTGEDKNKKAADNARIVLEYLQGPATDMHSKKTWVHIHPHALGQLCDLVKVPRIWLNRNDTDSDNGWRRVMLVRDLNDCFANTTLLNARRQPAEFLHRKVRNELRAVLTQSYNRHLVSAVVLQPFLDVCREVGLQATRALVTDMRVGLQTYLPFAFQPIPGEFVALGCWWGNSDFGQGKVRVSHTVMRISSGSSLLTEDSFSRVHLGSVVTDTDLKLDDTVAVKELDAVAAGTQSAVRACMDPEQVHKVLDAIRAAHEATIPWQKLKDNMAKFLTKDELVDLENALSGGITELPQAGRASDGSLLPSKWWAAAAVSMLAEKQIDEGRAGELKQAAGQYLEAT